MTQYASPVAVPKHRSPWAVPLSVLAHAGLIVALVLSVAWKSEPPPALQAELWEAIPSTPSPVVAVPETKPEPMLPAVEAVKPVAPKVPEPEPEAIAPKVVKKEKAVKKLIPEPEPEQPKKVIKPQPKPEPKSDPKSDSKPLVKSTLKSEPKTEVKPDTTARDMARAKEIARMNQLSQSAGLAGAPNVGTPQAGSSQGLGASWGAKLKACVQPNLRYSDSSGDNLRVVFVVKLNPSGTPSDTVVSKSSGNAAFDAAVSRALMRCDPFPKPETGGYPASVTVAYRLND